MGVGQGTNPRTGTFLELPQNRDRREPIAPDELRSSFAKAPFPGAFVLSALGGTVHANLRMETIFTGGPYR